MQIATMRKDRIPVAVSTVILAIVTITYKLVLVLICVVVLTVRPVALMCYLSDVLWLMYLGVALNIICVAGLLLLVFDPNLIQFIAEKVAAFLCWLHLVKEPQKLTERLGHTLEQYRGTASFFQSHKLVVLWSFLITIAQRVILFFVTWLVYRAFHLSGTSAFVIITLQAMISVAVDMLPLPGGMGISEKLFSTIFLPIFGELRITAGMVLSRGISYYTQLLISGVMTVAATIILKREES